MKIEAGKYYRTRDGQVSGPIQRNFTGDGFKYYKEDGSFVGAARVMDLISEVCVSDTPPAVQETEADWRAKLLAAGPGPFLEVYDRKTLRDEFAIAIVAAFLSRPLSDNELTPEQCQIVWDNADAMMEARKK
jgi:hypothetical protein